MKTLAFIAVCTCGLGLAGPAHACERGLSQQLASAGDHLMASVAATLRAATSVRTSQPTGADTGDAGNSSEPLGRLGTEASVSPPAGDVMQVPAAANASAKADRRPHDTDGGGGGGAISNHDGNAQPVRAFGWQSLLPGSIQ